MRMPKLKRFILTTAIIGCAGFLGTIAYNQIRYRGTEDLGDYQASYKPNGFFHHTRYITAKDGSQRAIETAGLTNLLFDREIAIDKNADGRAEQIVTIKSNLRSGRFLTAPEGQMYPRTSSDEPQFARADQSLARFACRR